MVYHNRSLLRSREVLQRAFSQRKMQRLMERCDLFVALSTITITFLSCRLFLCRFFGGSEKGGKKSRKERKGKSHQFLERCNK